jgi:glycerate-2-kinase
MARSMLSVSSRYIKEGLLIYPKSIRSVEDIEYVGRYGVEALEGGFPLPNNDSIVSTRKMIDFILGLDDDSIVVVLISGGGSSLFEDPLENVSLDELREAYSLLMYKGLNVKEKTIVKKHISKVKGGRLVKYIYPRRCISLILSSVYDDDISAVAGGPTAPDPSTYEDAKNILNYYGIWEYMPTTVERIIMRGIEGELPETPKPGDPLFKNVNNIIVGSGRIGLKMMKAYAESIGYNAFFLTSRLVGEAREMGRMVGSLIEEMYYDYHPIEPPSILLIGGETTVKVRGDGVGGRNQEFLLPIIKIIKDIHGVSVIAFNTDGIDGISPAGGAVIDGCTYNESIKLGLSIDDALNNNDSYTFFSRLGRALISGSTGTDVNDYIIAVITL